MRNPGTLYRAAILLAIGLAGSSAQLNAQPSGQVSAQDIEQGHQIAKTNCTRCHAIGPAGESPNKDAPPFREIVKRYSPWLLAEAFAEGITTGHNEMPAFKFNPEEITSLLTYLESLEEAQDKSKPSDQRSE